MAEKAYPLFGLRSYGGLLRLPNAKGKAFVDKLLLSLLHVSGSFKLYY
jgi:hypothetical protein